MNLYVYEDIVYECFSSLIIPTDAKENVISYTMRFRIKSNEYKLN